MLQLANLFLDIALLRRNPQDLPASPLLLRVSLLAVVISYVLALGSRYSLFESLARALVDVAFLGVFVYALLMWARHGARFNQSFTALCGTGTILNLVSWPVFGLLNEGAAGDSFGTLGLLLMIGIVIWGIAVTAHIFRQALNRDWSQAVAMSLLYMFCAYTTGALLFSDNAAAT
jgi:hypothetical protein